MPVLTIVTATKGETDGHGNSFAGHMYYVLTDDYGNDKSFGWAPDAAHQGNPIAPGDVYTDDNKTYKPLEYSASSVAITEAQYNTLRDFGTEGSASYLQGMSQTYNILSNSCIDFVWRAAELIGIEQPGHIPGTELIPIWNAPNVDQALSEWASANNAAFESDPGDGSYGYSGGYGSYGTYGFYGYGHYGFYGAYGGYGYGGYGGYYGGDYGGGWRVAGKGGKGSLATAGSIEDIAREDQAAGGITAVADADAYASYTLAGAARKSPGSAALHDAALFDEQVVTWSIAQRQGDAGAAAGSITAENEAAIRAAFGTWMASAPGITFKEVGAATPTDIEVAIGGDGTAASVVSLTTQQGTTAFAVTSEGQVAAAGSDVSLAQAMTHEIGRALGMADTDDPNSIMYRGLAPAQASFDGSTALAVASPDVSGGVNQLIQAMATFNADAGAAETVVGAAELGVRPVIAADQPNYG